MSASQPVSSPSQRLRQLPRRATRALGGLLLAWIASWSSLASDPEADIHLYPFF